MAIVGYLEGTNPDLLSELCAQGHDALPLGNGVDDHGKYIAHLTKDDDVSVVIAYFHKLTPVTGMETFEVEDLLHGCITHDIPVLIVVPDKAKEAVKEQTVAPKRLVSLVSSSELREEVLKIIQ